MDSTWLGQHNRREHYEGKPTQLTIVSKVTPTDRKYITHSKEVPTRKLEVYQRQRAIGSEREWFMQGNFRRCYSTRGATIYPRRHHGSTPTTATTGGNTAMKGAVRTEHSPLVSTVSDAT